MNNSVYLIASTDQFVSLIIVVPRDCLQSPRRLTFTPHPVFCLLFRTHHAKLELELEL